MMVKARVTLGAILIIIGWTGAVVAASSPSSIKATVVEHKTAYALKPERGPYLDIKVTPPEIRGQEGRIMIEVYNRGKEHLASVTFSVTLFNQGGFDLTAPVTAEDLKPNMSGGQWVKIPQIKGVFPKIIGAKVTNLRIINVQAREIPMK
ncbi:MAG: hypothetical protein NTV34_03000, partial [Proteobacteria bacterium]|nr:hypothetical protein [Pseudomonadota bacterium]